MARLRPVRSSQPVDWKPGDAPILPILTKQVVYPPSPLSPAISLQQLEQYVAVSVRISRKLDLLGGRPHDQRVREALAAAREAGCSNAQLDEAIRTGIARAGHTFRLPAAAELEPEEASLEWLLQDAHGRLNGRDRLVS